MGTGLVHCSEHWTKVEQNEQMNNEHLIFDPLNTWTWTRFFWACSEHMNMNTLISMLFNFCSSCSEQKLNTEHCVLNIVLKLFICSKSFPFWFGILLFGISLFGIPCEWLILFSHTLRIEKDRIQLERARNTKNEKIASKSDWEWRT